MDEKDVFMILGINDREDSYTNLISHAFDNNEIFKKNFCNFFAHYPSQDFVLSIRNEHIMPDKKKEIPDMILYSRQNSEIILIENKIFSGEGYMQTERYSNQDFIVTVKEKLNMPNAKFEKFYFITLDGKNAGCDKFETVKWSEFILECTNNVDFKEKRLSFLMNDLILRSRHYGEFMKPADETQFNDYFNRCTKWVNYEKAFKCFFSDIKEELEKDEQFNVRFSTAHNVDGKHLLIVFYNPKWIGAEFGQENNSALEGETYKNLHIELKWAEESSTLSLFIHYETNPYKTKSELKEIELKYGKQVSAYKEKRGIFQNKLYEHMPVGWKKIGRSLTMIKTCKPLTATTTYYEIKTWLIENVKLAYDCITKTISML